MTDFDHYKQNLLNKLTAEYNSDMAALATQLSNNLQMINRKNILKIQKIQKIHLINAVKNIYNYNIKRLTILFSENKTKIEKLTPRKKSLLIGINYIGTPNELNGCINDVNNVNECLQKYSITNSVILTDLTDKKPTKQNIINELTNLLDYSNIGDFNFFLFSGHGGYTFDRSGDEMDRRDEMIYPLNTQSPILDDELRKIIDQKLRKDIRLFMLFDSCFSGTILDLRYQYLDSENYNILTVNPRVQPTKGQIVTISGCTDRQTSADTVVDYTGKKMYSGAMTYAFLKTIQDLGSNISFKTLIQYMRKILKENGYEQIPQLLSGQELNIDDTIWL